MPEFDPANMTYIPEAENWTDKVFQLEDGYLPTGGTINDATGGGTMNRQAKALADRTLFLKSLLETLQQSLAALTNGAPDDLNTLSEVASALGGNPNFSATIANDIAAIRTALSNLTNGAPSNLNTLPELAAALGDDPSFSTTISNEITGIKTTLSNLTNGAPVTLDSFNELAAALGDDPNFATTILGELASLKTKVAQADPIGRPVFCITRTPPHNHIFLQGQDLPRSSYPKLLAFVNDNASDIYDPTGAEKGKFRPGSSSAMFRPPDLRSRFPTGAPISSNVLVTHGGSSMASEVAINQTNNGLYHTLVGVKHIGYYRMDARGARHATRFLVDGSTTLKGNNEGDGPDNTNRALYRFTPPSVTMNIAIRYA